MTKEELVKIAKTKLKHKQRFIALRDTIANECIGNSFYSKENGMVGSSWDYHPDIDTLYVCGYGRYVVYEKGVWFDKVETTYEIY